MIVYRSLRALALALRSVQTGLLRATFLASDHAEYAGRQAKRTARAAIDRKIDKGYRKVDNLFAAAGLAQARAEDAADEWSFDKVDHEERLRLIDAEVL